MEDTIFRDSGNWKLLRERRVRSFVHLSAIIFIVTALSWIVITSLASMWLLTGLLTVILLLGLLVLKFVRENKLQRACFLLIGAGGGHFTLICLFTTGELSGNYTTHLWFIVMALGSYFLLTDTKPWIRESFPMVFLALGALFHLDIISGYNWIVMPDSAHRIVSVIDVVSAFTVILVLTRLFVLEITKAESVLISYSDRLDSIIENILPKSIADRLKKEGRTFADYYPDCSVLFADIVSFTPWTEKHTPEEVVQRLNSVFSRLDELADRFQVTKIKTMGDSYMVASGIPDYRSDHIHSLIAFASEIHRIAASYSGLQFRVGIHTGPVVAGVIGRKRIIYDLWGDTVNVASRLEGAAAPATTLISAAVWEGLPDKTGNLRRISVDLKGKGAVDAYII